MQDSIYSPEEDSFFMSNFLNQEVFLMIKKNSGLNVLEVGCGSGMNLKTILKAGVKIENVFSCDINAEAVEYCKKLGFNCVESDLFENISNDRKFNLIISV